MSYNNTTNRLTSHTDTVGGSRSLSYDERGNVTALGAQNFVYDLRNQPKSISGTASGTYEYDGNKKRVKSVVDGKTLYFVYDASGKLMIVDRPDFVTPANNERVYYLHAAGKTILRYTHKTNGSNTIDYLHNDHLGSANSATGSSGTIKWREQYSPFGERLSQIAANDNLDGFTGHVFDKATGLNYMQARYYDPLIGRFLSIDPLGFEQTGSPGMFNRYAYVLNDPINGVDLDGNKCSCILLFPFITNNPVSSDISTGLRIGLQKRAKFEGEVDNYKDARRHAEWHYEMSGELYTGRYGAWLIGVGWEIKGLFDNTPGQRAMDFNNNREGHKARAENRPINDANLITSVDDTDRYGAENYTDYHDGSPANSSGQNSSTQGDSISIGVSVSRSGSRISRKATIVCSKDAEGNTSCN